MYYNSVVPAVFLERINRFTALIRIQGTIVKCHVKNTGRCRELLLPETPVYVRHCPSPSRSTDYDLITVLRQDGELVNLDSQAPNLAAAEWIRKMAPDVRIHPEYTWGNSRFDFLLDQRTLMEVKGVTLLEDGVACFPDAPTLRGVKHLEELIHAGKEGFQAYVLFVIQMKGARQLRPNDRTHPEFGAALRKAAANGVHILAYDCRITPDSIQIDQSVPVIL